MRWPGCSAKSGGRSASSQELALDLNASGPPWDGTLRPRAEDASIELLLPPQARPRRRGRVAGQAPQSSSPAARAARDRLVLDSFDGRLRAAGLRAERPPGRGRGVLTIHEPGAPGRQVEGGGGEALPGRASCPVARCGGRLAEVLDMRALLPVVRLRSSVLPLAVVNGARQDRGAARDRARRGGRRLSPARPALAPRLTVEPVLGYDGDLERTLRVLRERLGLEPAERPVLDEAVVATGGPPRGCVVEAEGRARPGHARRCGRRRGAHPARRRSPRPTSRARSPTSTPSSSTTCAWRCGAPAPSCASSKGVHDPDQRARPCAPSSSGSRPPTGPVRDLDVQLLGWDEPDRPARERARGRPRAPVELAGAAACARVPGRLRRSLRGARFAAALAVLASARNDRTCRH